jgi:hypothetical protein
VYKQSPQITLHMTYLQADFARPGTAESTLSGLAIARGGADGLEQHHAMNAFLI